MSNHALERTSPKGGPFFGTCMKCGATNLPMSAVALPCSNPANLSNDETVILAIEGGKEPNDAD